MNESLKPVVIVGGGFTGLFTALHLRHQKCSRPIILIEQQWRFIFKPLLYELLTSEVKFDLVWPRYDELLAGSDIIFIRDRISHIDLKERRVSLDSGLCYSYEYLVLALGSTAGYFDIPGAREHTFTFRMGEDVFQLGAGTLLKLGMGESVAEIYDRFEIKGKAGHLIRQATYLEMLPTPLHNFKATTQWLTEGIFQKFIDA
ncbi:MAG: FAD-dependent oxidoreductase [Pleurocapsa sp. MO_192.B19]|nr:FAD-dependent oxidoreductase [Pleurocapsa sp. MO_192.B19]